MKRKDYASTGRDVHVDQALSNVAIAYMPKNFIAAELAPIVPVRHQSDAFNIWSIADAFRSEDDKRAPGVEANVITREVSSDTYFADNYALKDRIPYEDIKNADPGWVFTTRASRAEFIKSKLYINWEKRCADLCRSNSNVGTYTVVASAWTTYTAAKSDPYGMIIDGITAVEDATGYRPNKILFGGYAWTHFREHADVLDRVYGSGQNKADRVRVARQQDVAALFEVDQILVGRAYYNSAGEGQSASLAQIWNDDVLIYYAPQRPSVNEPSFLYSFRWNAIPGMDMVAEVFDLPRAKSEEVQLGYYQDEKITASDLSYLIQGVGSSQ